MTGNGLLLLLLLKLCANMKVEACRVWLQELGAQSERCNDLRSATIPLDQRERNEACLSATICKIGSFHNS